MAEALLAGSMCHQAVGAKPKRARGQQQLHAGAAGGAAASDKRPRLAAAAERALEGAHATMDAFLLDVKATADAIRCVAIESWTVGCMQGGLSI